MGKYKQIGSGGRIIAYQLQRVCQAGFLFKPYRDIRQCLIQISL